MVEGHKEGSKFHPHRTKQKGITSKHIGFEGLAHKAEKFYVSKGVPRTEAKIIGEKIAAKVNRLYVHHSPHR